jgi:amidase
VVGSVVEPILADVTDALEDEGATVIDNGTTDIDIPADLPELFALLCEFKTDIATYLDTYVDGTNPLTGQPYPQTLAQLIAFDQAHPEREGPWNDLIFELADGTNGRDGDCADFREATTPPVQATINKVMADNDLDAIIALTNGPAWPTNSNPEEGDLDGRFPEFFVGSSGAAAVSGYADITVPAGYIEGLPIGITFIGGRWDEPDLLGFAYDYEQATQIRVPPQFIPSIGDELFPGVPDSLVGTDAQPQLATQGQRDLGVRLR